MPSVTMPSPGGGLLGGLAEGLKQGLITYQTMKGIQHSQQMQELAAGVQKDDQGNLQLGPDMQAQRQLAGAQTQRGLHSLDPSSQESASARAFAKGAFQQSNPNASEDQLAAMFPETLAAADVKDYAPTFGKTVVSGGYGVQGAKEKGDATVLAGEKANKSRNDIADKHNKTIEDIEAKKLSAAQAAAAKKDAKEDNKGFLGLQNDLDPNKARGGNLAKSQSVVNATDRVEGLFSQFPDGNIPKAQATEIATAIASLISGGSPQSQHQIDQMVPSSIQGRAADIASWWSGNPTGREQQAFMSMLRETGKRERAIAVSQVHQAQAERIPGYQYLYKQDPEKYKGMLKARGFQDSEIGPNGEYVAAQPAAGGGLLQGAGGTPSIDPKIDAYAKQNNLDYAHAQAILKARGYGQ